MKRVIIKNYNFVADALYEIFEHLMIAQADDSFEFVPEGREYGFMVTPQPKYQTTPDNREVPALPFYTFNWEMYNDKCGVYRGMEWGWTLKVNENLFFISMPGNIPSGFKMNCWYRNFYTRGNKNSLI